ncbi:MAG: NAD(P)/FAD-dependent oxidoreductase [Desulfobulbaceae bacterium]|nr:NAD(P)/FAD-dependent oxidoreductase [Desulfobulbaceae bacterium]
MQQFDTVIIGGGPGGLACAAALAHKGAKVLLLERKQRLGAKVCAGGVTWSGLGAKLPPELIERSFAVQKISSSWQTATLQAHIPIISTVNRLHLGRHMAEKALAAGATIKAGVSVREIHDHHLTTTDGAFGYRFLVGADGSSSLVRRYLRLPAERMGIGINCQMETTFAEMEWCLDSKRFGCGYAWIFPHRDSTSIGAYVDRRAMNATTLLERFLDWCAHRGIDLHGCRPRASLINFDFRGYRFGNRFLVGDAAGLASGLTGEGIYPAILSGETIAELIADPAADTGRLDRLIHRQRHHHRFLSRVGKNRLCSLLCSEAILLGLRTGLIPLHALEMGAEQPAPSQPQSHRYHQQGSAR